MKLGDTISYDPETGIFRWKVAGPKRRKGQIAGSISGQGYTRITIDRVSYRGARLAWYLTYNVWPKEVDHINQNKSDDRLVNLREVTRAENLINSSARTSSGAKGVYWNEKLKKWEARVRRNYKSIHLGLFLSIEEAVAARNAYLESIT